MPTLRERAGGILPLWRLLCQNVQPDEEQVNFQEKSLWPKQQSLPVPFLLMPLYDTAKSTTPPSHSTSQYWLPWRPCLHRAWWKKVNLSGWSGWAWSLSPHDISLFLSDKQRCPATVLGSTSTVESAGTDETLVQLMRLSSTFVLYAKWSCLLLYLVKSCLLDSISSCNLGIFDTVMKRNNTDHCFYIIT